MMKRLGMKSFGWTVVVLLSTGAAMAEKHEDPATLRDVQPTNTPAMKKTHQQFDFSIVTAGRNYTCRTLADKKIKAADFVVGSQVTFEYSRSTGEVKTVDGKKAKCSIVRVENAQ